MGGEAYANRNRLPAFAVEQRCRHRIERMVCEFRRRTELDRAPDRRLLRHQYRHEVFDAAWLEWIDEMVGDGRKRTAPPARHSRIPGVARGHRQDAISVSLRTKKRLTPNQVQDRHNAPHNRHARLVSPYIRWDNHIFGGINNDTFSMSNRQKGLTLIEMLVLIAILAIIAAIAIPNWVAQVQQENRNEAIDNGRSAIQQLYMTALSSGGASLSATYGPNLTTYTVSATASGISATYSIRSPKGTILLLNAPTASAVSCFSIDGKGFPVAANGCSVPANLAYPLSWSVSYAGQSVPLSVQ